MDGVMIKMAQLVTNGKEGVQQFGFSLQLHVYHTVKHAHSNPCLWQTPTPLQKKIT